MLIDPDPESVQIASLKPGMIDLLEFWDQRGQPWEKLWFSGGRSRWAERPVCEVVDRSL